MNNNVRSFQALPSVLIVTLLVLAPFVGGTHEVNEVAVPCVIALLAALVFLWTEPIRRPVGTLPLALFVLLVAASCAVTASIHASIEYTLYFASCAAAAIVASSVFGESKSRRLAALGIVASALVLGMMAVLEFKQVGGTWRVFTTFESPGYLGGYLVLVLPVTLAVLLGSRHAVLSAVALVAWGLAVAALMLTGTRLAIAFSGMGCVAFTILAIWTRTLGRRQIAWIAAALVLAVVVAVAANAPTTARLRGKAASEQSESGPFRVATWKGTLRIIEAHPLLGTGAGTFELVFPRYTVAGYTRNAHNSYLQIASDSGIPALAAGAGAFIVLFLAGLVTLRRRDDPESTLFLPNATTLISCGMLAALVGSLARNLFDSDLHNPAIGVTFWALAGIVASRRGELRAVKLSIAIRAVLTAVVLAALAAWWLFVMGQFYGDVAREELVSGERLSALDSIHSAIRVDPLRGDWWLFLGQMEVGGSAGDEAEWRKGVSDIKHAARLEPTRARNWIILGRIYSDGGDAKEALAAFGRGLSLDPHATSAMLESARLLKGEASDRMYQRMFREEESPFELLRGVKELVNTDYAWAHYEVGQRLLRAGEKSRAAGHFRSAIERLNRWKSNDVPRKAAEAAGLLNAGDNAQIEQLLTDCKNALSQAESGPKGSDR